MKRTIVLLILDGWGVGRNDITNAICAAQPINFTELTRRYPSGTLLAHGIAVGLPWENAGTGEAGHLTIGAGRTVYQPPVTIALAIRDGSFFTNPILHAALENTAKMKGTAHFIETLTEKNALAAGRLTALIAFAKSAGVPRIRIHAILNGINSSPHAAFSLIQKLPLEDTIKLGSISGRYYATDGNTDTKKNEMAVNAILGIGAKTDDIETYMHDFYLHGMTDEFTEPVALGPDPRGVEENDAIIFCDCDGDTQGTLARRIKNGQSTPKNVSVTTLADWGISATVSVAFTDDRPATTLSTTLAEHKKTQFRIAETCRYPHVTYFMNGLSDKAVEGEYRILVPSENVARKDDRPEMMMSEVANRGIAAIEEGADFVVMNFAAPDVMAHTGNFEATKQAVRAADRELGNVTKAVLARDGVLIVTSDHGNAEQMRDSITGTTETGHNANPVPVIIIAKEFEKSVNKGAAPSYEATTGLLTDIAPTVLALMKIKQPAEMTGSSLIGKLA